MKQSLLLLLATLSILTTRAQKSEAFFDFSFRPSEYARYYYVVTEKKDSLWHREAYYVSQRSLAMEGWFKDDSCRVPHGIVNWYHTTKFPKSTGTYNNGKKTGIWLEYDEQGHMTDSSEYVNGRLKGDAYKWYPDGMLSDSLQFDGEGNGVQLSWYNSGKLSTAGFWTQDTVKKGRWKYFDEEGAVWATEDYVDGKMVGCSCFDGTGKKLDSADCIEKEASPGGGINGWRRFMEKNLMPIVESKARAGVKSGQYNVVIRFVVDKEGNLGDFKAMTKYGQGMEEDVINMLKKAPKWVPGKLHGRPVKSYHTQPISFIISS
jgi:antitoxin component YwqK of YwqJK toxin-antitoxin module